MLRTELRRYKAVTPLGKSLGYVNDIVVDANTWNVKGVVIAKFMKRLEYSIEVVGEMDKDIRKLTITDASTGQKLAKPSLEHMTGRELMKRRVFSNDKKDIGFLYNFDIASDHDPWQIKKILIFHGRTKRRLRENPTDISAITDKIILSKDGEAIEKGE